MRRFPTLWDILQSVVSIVRSHDIMNAHPQNFREMQHRIKILLHEHLPMQEFILAVVDSYFIKWSKDSALYLPTLSAIRKISASDMLSAVYSRMQLYVGEIVQHR